MRDDRSDQVPRELRRRRIALDLRQVPLQDGVSRALPEVGLEDGRERKAPTGPPGPDAVRRRRHRPGR
jgi:hypothetical protein